MLFEGNTIFMLVFKRNVTADIAYAGTQNHNTHP